MTGSVIVWSDLGRVVILRVYIDRLFDCTGYGVVCMRVVVSSLLNT